MQLLAKTVVVVGGSSGIGLSTAELAKREGADVMIASRNAVHLGSLADKLKAIAIPTDVTDDSSVINLFRSTGPVDHVVVTAAQLRTGPFKTVSMDDARLHGEQVLGRLAGRANSGIPWRWIAHAGFLLS
jgi:NADP-dependent 3-hydroxy acid dehydrogenase YdfG